MEHRFCPKFFRRRVTLVRFQWQFVSCQLTPSRSFVNYERFCLATVQMASSAFFLARDSLFANVLDTIKGQAVKS